MFKKPSAKRKKPSGTRRRVADEDEDETNDNNKAASKDSTAVDSSSAFVQAAKLKQKKRGAKEFVRPDAVRIQYNKKKAKPGSMGFGGGEFIPPEDVTTETSNSSLYTKDYLQQLKAEQRELQLPKSEISNNEVNDLAQTTSTSGEKSDQTRKPPEDFISLNNNDSTSERILTGNEAMAYEEGDDAFDSEEALERALLDDDSGKDEAKFDDDWGDQLAQRAKWGSAPIGTKVRPSTETPKPASVTLHQFQDHVSKTLEAIQLQKTNIQDQIRRRKDQLVDSKSTIEKHRADVVSVGTALEFYQRWRIRLCDYIATLRTIQTSLDSVRSVSRTWHADVANVTTWATTWQDDVAQSLHKLQCLDQVLGRDVQCAEEATEVTKDEFGRVMQSKEALLREKRASRRYRIQSQYQKRHIPKADTLIRGDLVNLEDTPAVLRGDESDAIWSEDEEEALRTRHSALKEAIMVACDSIDHPECTVLQNLFDLFKEWHATHPDEYNQCYASLSLADLASVLISAEVLLLNDPWDDSSGYNEMKWLSVVHTALKEKYMDEAAVDRLVEKTAVPLLTDLFEAKGVNVVSRRQVRSLGMFVEHLLRILPKDKPESPVKSASQLVNLVSQFTVDFLDNIAVPITSKPTEVSGHATKQMTPVEQAAYDATWGQIRRLRKIVTNLVDLWGPFMKTDAAFATAVLDFVSNRFLFALSSMGDVKGDGLRQSKLDDFSAIYMSIKEHTDWLEDPVLMIPAAPVTGAALAYHVAEEQ